MLVSYYLPGNSHAPPPTHLADGPTSRWRWSKTYLTPARLAGGWEVEQGHTPYSSRVAGGRVEEQCEVDQEHHSVY